MQTHLRRLERPIPGTGGARIAGLFGFEEELPSLQDNDSATFVIGEYEEEPQTLIFMNESLLVLPEVVDEEQLAEIFPHLDDPNVLFVAGDLDYETVFEKDEAVAILEWPCATVPPQENLQRRLHHDQATIHRERHRQRQRRWAHESHH